MAAGTDVERRRCSDAQATAGDGTWTGAPSCTERTVPVYPLPMPHAEVRPDAIRDLAVRLLGRVPELAEEAVQETLAAEPSYRARVPRGEFRARAAEGFAVLLHGIEGRPAGAAARQVEERIARERAEQGIPLDALIRTWHRDFRIIWRAIVAEADEHAPELLPELARSVERVWASVEDSTARVAAGYLRSETAIAREQHLRRQFVLDGLLGGDVSADPGEAAAVLGLPGAPYVVLAAVGAEEPLAVESELQRILTPLSIDWAWRYEWPELHGVVALQRVAGSTHDLFEEARGVRIGLSAVYDDLGATGAHLQQARIALQTLRGRTGIALFDDHLLEALVLQDPQIALRLARQTLRGILDLPQGQRDRLLHTLEVHLASSSVEESAARLFCHRNTLRYRLRQIEQLTGRSSRNPRDLAELALALTAAHSLRARPA